MTDDHEALRRRRPIIAGIGTPIVEAGPPTSSEAVVLVHGNPGSAEEFAALVGGLGASTRAVAVNLPGFGEAHRPDDFSHTVAGHARHLGRVLDTLGIERAHLVLHDFGGAWGLRWAADHPGRTGSVVVMNAAGMPGYRWHKLARAWRLPGLGELVMAATSRPVFRAVLGEGNPTPLPSDDLERMYRQFDAQTRRAVLRLYRATDLADHEWMVPLLARQDLPALVLWGEADPYLSLVQAQRFADVFPRARFVRIRGSGHWPHLTAPVTVREILGRWVDGHLEAGDRRSVSARR